MADGPGFDQAATDEAVAAEAVAADGSGAATADWIRAFLLIAAIIAVVIVLFLFGIGGFCDCTTRPAGG
jgi:hypothetical protein